MIHNLVFDMGNVLLDYRPLDDLTRITGNPQQAALICRELNGGPEWRLMDQGLLTEEEGFARVLRRLPGLEKEARAYWENWQYFMFDIPGMPELIRDLSEREYPLYILSNVSVRFRLLQKEHDVFRYFRGCLVSAEEKLLKPDPRIYRRFCEKFGLLPEECFFIDDKSANVDAAIAVGFSGIPFESAEQLRNYFTNSSIL